MHYAQAMLLPRAPTAYVGLPAWPVEGALPIFLAMLEVAFVASPVRPSLHPAALHLPEAELPLVEFVQIGEVVLAEAGELAVDEISLKEGAILPLELALALLLPLVEFSNIGSLRFAGSAPGLDSFTMLQVLQPVALILGF